jgi:hypothetical protein
VLDRSWADICGELFAYYEAAIAQDRPTRTSARSTRVSA